MRLGLLQQMMSLNLTQSSPTHFKNGFWVLRRLQLPAVVAAALGAVRRQTGANLGEKRSNFLLLQVGFVTFENSVK